MSMLLARALCLALDFLLPGIAAMETGNSVYLSYLVAGFLILPSMLTVAELSTAMPRAGSLLFFGS